MPHLRRQRIERCVRRVKPQLRGKPRFRGRTIKQSAFAICNARIGRTVKARRR